MSRFECPCGLKAEVDADQMLDFIRAHNCDYYAAAPTSPPRSASAAWAGAFETLLVVALILGVCAICGVVYR